MTTATDSTTQVQVADDDVRLLLKAFLFMEIHGVASYLEDTPGLSDLIRNPGVEEKHWALSKRLHEIERLIVELNDPATTMVALPFDRDRIAEVVREEVQYLLDEHAGEDRYGEVAAQGVRLLDALGEGGDA